jgi:hypothetical protein
MSSPPLTIARAAPLPAAAAFSDFARGKRRTNRSEVKPVPLGRLHACMRVLLLVLLLLVFT